MDTLQAAYDVRDGTYSPSDHQKLLWWLTDLGVDVNKTYRIEIHMAETRTVRVFQYALDENGRLYCPLDHSHMDGKVYGPGEEPREEDWCDVAKRKPFDLPIDAPPPVAPTPAYPPVSDPKSSQVNDPPKEAL